MEEDCKKLQDSLISIASEIFRFERVFEKAVSKLDDWEEQRKYESQHKWFSKKVAKALDDAGVRVISVEGQEYDPGMAVTPLNLGDFGADDILYVEHTLEPIIMQGDVVVKTGTVLLGRKD